MDKVTVDDLAYAIESQLSEYGEKITEGIKNKVDIVAKECNEEIKNHITFKNRTGKYLKAFAIKTTLESKNIKIKAWHVKAPHYRLTHLLEKGHAKIKGGRTKAYPHIKYGEELVKKRMVELSEEVINNAGR